MKKLLTFLLFIYSLATFSQNTSGHYDITEIPNYSYFKTKMDLTDIPLEFDSTPDFSGGIDEFRRKLSETLDHSTLGAEPDDEFNAIIYFVIEKDGKISNIFAMGKDQKYNELAIKSLKKMRTQWIPAKSQGKPARFLFVMPLSFTYH